MKKTSVWLLFWILSLFLLTQCSNPKMLETAKAARDGYQLVWADEFNAAGKPDSSQWGYEHGWVRNQEHQWYQEENTWCENGRLIIEARKTSLPNPSFQPGSKDWKKQREKIEYTSSSINTRGKKSWQYGRFVMRGKINTDPGLWPAWWTLGTTHRWPANGEIDIMEYYRGKLLANVASGSTVPGRPDWRSKTVPVDSLGGKAWSAEFHTWRMDWDEQHIALFVDDSVLLNVPVSQLANKDAEGFNPFFQPHYMLLNVAIGGMNGGDPSKTNFPNRFEIDYVRVYQKTR